MVAVVLYLSSSTHSLAYSLIQSTEDRLRHTLLLLDVEGAIAEAGTCFGMRAPPGARTKRNGGLPLLHCAALVVWLTAVPSSLVAWMPTYRQLAVLMWIRFLCSEQI
jgi:hypothetical protein